MLWGTAHASCSSAEVCLHDGRNQDQDSGLLMLLTSQCRVFRFGAVMFVCACVYGSRSKGPCKEFSIRRPSVLVEVAPRKIRDGVAKVTFFLAKVLRNCIWLINDMWNRSSFLLSLPSILITTLC